MKINIQKVIKCLTCLVTCFMVVFTATVSPAFAVEQGNIDPSNYITSITQDGDIKTINYRFNTPYLWRYWDNKSQTAQELQDDLAYCVPAGATQIAITSFPFGRYASPDQPATYGGVVIADILPNSPIDFSFEHDVHLQVTDAIRNIEITVVFEWGCYYYAEDGSYQGSIIMPTLTEKYSHETFTYLDAGKTLTGTFPAKAHHFIPWVRTSIYTPVLPSKMVIYGAVSQPSMSVSLNSILADSNTMDAIKDKLDDLNNGIGDVNDKLDGIINGTPNQNESADNAADDLGNKKEDIEDLVDQMKPSRPNLDKIDTDVNAWAGDEATSLFADGMASILNHPIILAMLSIVAVVSFIGYVLFGKGG